MILIFTLKRNKMQRNDRRKQQNSSAAQTASMWGTAAAITLPVARPARSQQPGPADVHTASETDD